MNKFFRSVFVKMTLLATAAIALSGCVVIPLDGYYGHDRYDRGRHYDRWDHDRRW